jgi:predicted O-methyltransferase YrrM
MKQSARSRLLTALRVSGKYMGRSVTRPRDTRRFVGSLLNYIAAYSPDEVDLAALPERPLHDIFPGINEQSVCLQHTVEPKALPFGEAYVLASVASYLRPARVFEIGTFTGGGTLIMATQAGPECSIFTLDMPPGDDNLVLQGLAEDPPEQDSQRIGERFRDTQYERQITQLFGDSATFDYAPYRGNVDLVFVDGSHSYSYVKSDTHKALEMLSGTGTIIWDDCSLQYPGVVRALQGFNRRIPIFRVPSTRFAIYTRHPGLSGR